MMDKASWAVPCLARTSETSRVSIWFVWSVWFVWFIELVWFNQINKTNQINQLNEIDQTDQMNKIRLHGTASVCQQDAEKVALLTRPTPAATSPARPEAAKTASLPRDAPFLERRSQHP